MFLARSCAVLGFGLMLAAASTQAREFELSLESRITAENNVFRSSDDRTPDGFYTIAPRIALRESNSKLNYDVAYRPSYDTYFDTQGIDGFDHAASTSLSWRPTSADTFGMSGTYADRRSLRVEDEAGLGVLVETDRRRLRNSNATVSYARRIQEEFSIQTSASLTNLDYSDGESIDSGSYSVSAGLQYFMSPITITGLSVMVRESRSRPGRGLQNRPNGIPFDTDTEIWNVGASIQRSLTPTIDLSLQGGPSFIQTNQEATTAGVNDISSRSTSYFAAGSITKTWQKAELKGSYTRSESSGGGNTSTSINDVITIDFTHDVSRRWSYQIYGTWLQSEEISGTPRVITLVPLLTRTDEQKTSQFRTYASVTHRLTQQLSVVGQISFFTQKQNNASNSDSIGDIYSGYLSLRYTFDPVVF